MSTQTPFNSAPVACGTNWLTRIACKLQQLVEPLCEMRTDFHLNTYEQNVLIAELWLVSHSTFHLAVTWYGTSGAVLGAIDRWQNENHQTIILSSEAQQILAPRLSLWNRVGLALWRGFSVGTECSCCWGFRVLGVFLLGGVAGHYA